MLESWNLKLAYVWTRKALKNVEDERLVVCHSGPTIL